MTTLYLTLGAGNCLATAWQDFRTREIHIIPLLLFAASGFCYRYERVGWGFLEEWLTNVLLLSTMFGLVWLGYRFRGAKQVMDVKMGWGDVIFLFILGIWLEPFLFLFFYTANTFLLSIIFLGGRMLGIIPETYPIPLAGILGLTCTVCIPWWHLYPPMITL